MSKMFLQPSSIQLVDTKGNNSHSTPSYCYVKEDPCVILVDGNQDLMFDEPRKKFKTFNESTQAANKVNEGHQYCLEKPVQQANTTKVVPVDKVMKLEKSYSRDIDPRKRIYKRQAVYQGLQAGQERCVKIISLDVDNDDGSKEKLFIPFSGSEEVMCSSTTGDDENNGFSNDASSEEDVSEIKSNLVQPLQFPELRINITDQAKESKETSTSSSCLANAFEAENVSLEKLGDCVDQNDDEYFHDFGGVTIHIDQATTIFEEELSLDLAPCIINNINPVHYATIPELINRDSNQVNKRILKLISNPSYIDSSILEDYVNRMGKIIDMNITNQEKAIKLLKKFDMDIDVTLMELKRNKVYYKNYFRLDPRVLRSKVPLV